MKGIFEAIEKFKTESEPKIESACACVPYTGGFDCIAGTAYIPNIGTNNIVIGCDIVNTTGSANCYITTTTSGGIAWQAVGGSRPATPAPQTPSDVPSDYVEAYLRVMESFVNSDKSFDKTVNEARARAESIDKAMQYSEYLATELDKGISYTQYLKDNLDKNIDYSEYVCGGDTDPRTANLPPIDYSKYMAEAMEK